MASKQPFKFFDWKQKLTRFYLRASKTISHRVLAKSRNALLLDPSTLSINSAQSSFSQKLRKKLKKTWEIYDLNLNENKQQVHHEKYMFKSIEQQFVGRQYDAIIVLPTSNNNIPNFYDIDSQQFATNLTAYKKALMSNLLAYRLAHKYLTTSGMLILSNSESDFAEVENKAKVQQAHMKNILDTQVGYLGVTVGDRDYTDLNSWSVVALSQQFLNDNQGDPQKREALEDYVVEMYTNWANGSNLPMPGSFALFKQEPDKKKPFVQYL